MIIGDIGQAAVRALLFVICGGAAVHVMALVTKRRLWQRWSQAAMVLQFVVAATASGCLVWLLVTLNFSYAYVAEYTGPGLPMLYRMAAFWGGNAGSLLFWALILTLYGAVVAFSRHEDSDRMVPVVSLILSAITLFYAIVLNYLTSPFLRLPRPMPPSGLNPLLQNPGMTVHPVNVYLGFVGFAVPFAYAMAGLLLKKTDATWLVVTRRWTLVSWLFLGIGIVYGAHWSYQELGWGGYWAWDPIENASLLPWLTGTAFLHSAIVQERRGMLKAWNVVLVTLTFLLTLLGTFLTRSGVLWSIHAFANGPLGGYFLVFLCVCLLLSTGLIVWRFNVLRADRKMEAVVSKESSFLLNNVLFLGSAFAVLWGTVFPIVSEAVTGRKMMVDAPFYNAVNLPLAVCIMVLMGVGPLVAWRTSTARRVVSSITYPLLGAIGAGLLISGGLQLYYHHSSILGTAGIIAACFVTITVVAEFVSAVRTRVSLANTSILSSTLTLIGRHRRRYGGYIVHFAVAVIAMGIAASGTFHVDIQQQMAVGDTADVGGFSLTFDGMGVANQGPDKRMYANLVVAKHGGVIGVLQPSATFYANGQSPSTNVALFSRPFRDLYVVILGTSGGQRAVFDMHVNPLVQFIWFGGYLFIVGSLVSLWPERRRSSAAVMVAVPAREDAIYKQMAELEYDFQMGKTEAHDYETTRAQLLHELQLFVERDESIRDQVRSEVEQAVRKATQHHVSGGEGADVRA